MKSLLKDFIRIFSRTLKMLLRAIELILPYKVACNLRNLFLFFMNSNLRFKYDKDTNLFIASEKNISRYFGNMKRGFDLYDKSLLKRGEDLHKTYCLNNINFKSSDVIIDCGANYADLFIPLQEIIDEENYIAFEPGPIEYKCISKSLPKARNFNLGLSNKDNLMKFYLCSATGDSSLVETQNYTEVIEVKVTTLDNFAKSYNIDHCKLLKLEAEGWEPEILDGAKDFIKKCEYIAIDGGPERGLNDELTFQSLNNKLLNSGYEMVDICGYAYRALYRNCIFNNVDTN